MHYPKPVKNDQFLPHDSQNGIKLNLFSVYFLTKQKSYKFVGIYYAERRHGCYAYRANR